MGIFKKKKIEVVNITFKEPNDKISDGEGINNVDREMENFKLLDQLQQKERINSEFNSLQKMVYQLLNDYYICKIFSRVALKDKDFNLQMLAIDKHINKMKKDFEELQKQVNKTKYDLVDADNLLDTYQLARNIYLFYRGIANNIEDAKYKYFNYLKIATVNVCMHKTNQELEDFYKNIAEFLKDYKNLAEAAEYIYYNSGNMITNVINTVIEAINKSNNVEYIKTYNFKYFIKADVIITLSITEWIDVYSKLKFVGKLIDDDKLKGNINREMANFEMCYLILMMYVETNKDSKKLANFRM